jgi:hypothetical protein
MEVGHLEVHHNTPQVPHLIHVSATLPYTDTPNSPQEDSISFLVMT